MLTPAFFQHELTTGRLIQPFPHIGWAGQSYCLIYPHWRRNLPKLRRFRDWIVESTRPLREEQALRN